jgi:hypothetical protein
MSASAELYSEFENRESVNLTMWQPLADSGHGDKFLVFI